MEIEMDTSILTRSSERLTKLIALESPACIVLGEISILMSELMKLNSEASANAQIDHDELMEWRANRSRRRGGREAMVSAKGWQCPKCGHTYSGSDVEWYLSYFRDGDVDKCPGCGVVLPIGKFTKAANAAGGK